MERLLQELTKSINTRLYSLQLTKAKVNDPLLHKLMETRIDELQWVQKELQDLISIMEGTI